MPALVLFGRRSRIAGDDLHCPALALAVYQVPFLLKCVYYLTFWKRCSSMTLDLNGLVFWFILGCVPLYGFMGCIQLMIMHISSKGTMVDHERRVLIPVLLQVLAIWSLWMLGTAVFGLIAWSTLQLCHPDARFLLVSCVGMLIQIAFIAVFGVCILGGTPSTDIQARNDLSNPHGNAVDSERQALLDEVDRFMPSSDVYLPYQQRWQKRCRYCCTCVQVFTCNLFGGASTQHDSMSVVAKVMARLFYGTPDLVLSDLLAGFLLLAAVQAHEDRREAAGEEDMELGVLRKRRPGPSSSVIPDQKPLEPPAAPVSLMHVERLENELMAQNDIASRFIDVSSSVSVKVGSGDTVQPGQWKFSEEELHETLGDFVHYSNYSLCIFGWILYVWQYPWLGTFRLALSCATRSISYIHGDNLFNSNQAALKLFTGVATEDIIYVSFVNTICRPAFCVLINRQRKQVVISIRGTLSLEDCLTDTIAYAVPMDEYAERWGCDGKGEHAHQGFLHAAETIYLELNRLGVLEMLFDPNTRASISDEIRRCEKGSFRDYGLLLVGHSMGAGTAALLSVMLHPKYPNLRCLAYSPPGATMTAGLAERCKSYVTSLVIGNDIIPRATLPAIEQLRDQVIDMIRRSKVSKADILSQAISWKRPEDLLFESDDMQTSPLNVQLANYRTILRRIQEQEPVSETRIPGKIIHMKNPSLEELGGWACCRPGGGILCTERSNYDFDWASPDEFKTIRINRTMLDDHFPDKVQQVLFDCTQRLKPFAQVRARVDNQH